MNECTGCKYYTGIFWTGKKPCSECNGNYYEEDDEDEDDYENKSV